MYQLTTLLLIYVSFLNSIKILHMFVHINQFDNKLQLIVIISLNLM